MNGLPSLEVLLSSPHWPRFKRFLSISDGCWEWTGYRSKSGYGQIQWARRSARAHRIIYTVAGGVIPEGHMICHHCDNRACLRIDHLFCGTASDNVLDMTRKGRGRPALLRGEAVGTAKLTADQVGEIRRRISLGQNHREIGEDYQVTKSNISAIARGKSWRHA